MRDKRAINSPPQPPKVPGTSAISSQLPKVPGRAFVNSLPPNHLKSQEAVSKPPSHLKSQGAVSKSSQPPKVPGGDRQSLSKPITLLASRTPYGVDYKKKNILAIRKRTSGGSVPCVSHGLWVGKDTPRTGTLGGLAPRGVGTLGGFQGSATERTGTLGGSKGLSPRGLGL
jgi:hypothetical protein